MDVAFVDLAGTCAPAVQVEALAAVVSLESRFQPFNIRINGGTPLASQPASKAEAIEAATSLMAENQDIQLGLGGVGTKELQKLKLSISDAFDPCLNLKATASLLDGYYRLASREGADAAQAEQVMLWSYYGRNDPTVGAMVKYDEQVRQEVKRLAPRLASLTIAGPQEHADVVAQPDDAAERQLPTQSSRTAEALPWDVFSSRRRSSVLIFQNDRPEPTE
ncbi:transglycosylase SLT domain-containing protein [Phyllobacterium zundukense]|uniref:Transglycosylase SLT domain-containing protein n=1 Tax=Phyllobacterium zundukense TaxID=1867719 RepID=A0ACD4CW47_9HYPH|nr:transglycosylase SLT domain-containing protein [Phyllobacterium zundukense]UXN57778.1 transglycosylase SLT domain-containing protein [Phyllobacterium zundukense]